MADLTITAANVLAGANAKKRRGIAGATITAGQALYEDSSASYTLKLADNDASAATSKCVGISLHGALAGQPIEYVYEDDDFTPGATLTAGLVYVLSGTAGAIAVSADLGAGDYPVVLFCPNSTTKATLKIVRGTVVQ
jgi:hypothetical protein